MVTETIANCEEDHDNTICSPLVTLYPMCTPLILLEVFCIDLDFNFLDLHFVEYLEQGFRDLHREISNFVDVDVEIDGHFEVITNKTKTYPHIRDEVAAAFNSRTDRVFGILEATKILSILLSFYLFFSVYQFRHNYLTHLNYQNRYLLRSIHEINDIRMARGEPSVFPLNYAEERRFTVIYSWRVTYWELIQALRGIADVMWPCFYVACLLLAQYTLYYLLLVITQASDRTSVTTPPVVTVDIEGEGFVADFMHSIVGTYEPIINGFDIDFGVCAPHPHRPDDDRLILLLFLCSFCLVQSVVYPFAARAMHLTMERYYKEETRRRMAWLYNEILRRRKTLQMMVYERMSGKYRLKDVEDPVPIMAWLRSQLGDHWLCQWCFSGGAAAEGEQFCVNCGRALGGSRRRLEEEENKNKVAAKCPSYRCPAIYCADCIRQLNGVCILCKKNVRVRVNYAGLRLEVGVDENKF